MDIISFPIIVAGGALVFAGILAVCILFLEKRISELERNREIDFGILSNALTEVSDINKQLQDLDAYVHSNIHTSVEIQRQFYVLTNKTNQLENAMRIMNNGFVTPTQASMY